MPAEFENGFFTLKTHQMFSFHTTPEELINGKTTGYFEFVFKEDSVRVSSIFKMFIVHTKMQRRRQFSNSPCLKSIFEKLRFHGELVWTVGLTLEINLRVEISSA